MRCLMSWRRALETRAGQQPQSRWGALLQACRVSRHANMECGVWPFVVSTDRSRLEAIEPRPDETRPPAGTWSQREAHERIGVFG